MTLRLADYKYIAEKLQSGIYYPFEQLVNVDNVKGDYFGEVVAKERPRKGKNGRMFTPERTRKFEAAVRKWGEQFFEPVRYPIRVDLTVYDETDDPLLIDTSSIGIFYNMSNDLDNICKSILDGLNGVMYKDDKQIVQLRAARQYSTTNGFHIERERVGLTVEETKQLRKHLK